MRPLKIGLAATVLALTAAASPAPAKEPTQQALWVMSYNIRYDNPDDKPDWRARRGPMADQIRFFRPDILGLQEALLPMVADLAKALPAYESYGVGRDDGASQGESTTLFYRSDRFTRLAANTYWCSPTPDKPGKAYDAALPRTFTRLVLKDRLTGAILDVRNAHLDNVGAESRARCAAQILDLPPWPKAQLIAMGDFNSGPDEAPHRLLTTGATPYQDARDAASSVFSPPGTFNDFNVFTTGSPIDYILVDRRMSVGRFATPTDTANGAVISDHFPVIAEIWPMKTN